MIKQLGPITARGGTLQIHEIHSAEMLRREAVAWDHLWWRSDVTVPRARAGLIATWLDHFGSGARFRGVAVKQNGVLVAALPIVVARGKGVAHRAFVAFGRIAVHAPLQFSPANKTLDNDTDPAVLFRSGSHVVPCFSSIYQE